MWIHLTYFPTATNAPVWLNVSTSRGWRCRGIRSSGLSTSLVLRDIVAVILVDMLRTVRMEGIRAIDQQVNRRRDRNIAADGRIERNQHTLHHTVYDGFAVLGFVYLEVRRFHTRLDEIARSIDIKQGWSLAFDLAAYQYAGVKLCVVIFQVLAITLIGSTPRHRPVRPLQTGHLHYAYAARYLP